MSIENGRGIIMQLIKFLVGSGQDATRFQGILASIETLLEGRTTIEPAAVNGVVMAVLLGRLQQSDTVLQKPPSLLTDFIEKNNAMMMEWRRLQDSVRAWTAAANQSIAAMPPLDIRGDDARWLYNEFGDFEFMRMSRDITDADYEAAKDKLMYSPLPHVAHTRYWTRQLRTQGVYNVEPLRTVNELTRPDNVGIDARVIKAYNTIDLGRTPATFHDGKRLPARSRIAVYNATMEEKIFQNMPPCRRYQFTTRSNVAGAMLTAVDLHKLIGVSSKVELIEALSAEFYRILSSVYSRQNTDISNRREFYYLTYHSTFDVITRMQKAFEAEVEKIHIVFPVPNNMKIEALGIIKALIHRVINDANVDKNSADIEQTICV